MTKIKMCGLTRPEDIAAANQLRVNYVGFVFAPKSSRLVMPSQATRLREALDPEIQAVGVFVNEPAHEVAWLLNQGVIDIAQLHGYEDEAYLRRLRNLTDKPIWQAFRVKGREDLERAKRSGADRILLDSGGGHGTTLQLVPDWRAPAAIPAGRGADSWPAGMALKRLSPWGVDVSSGIETDGRKDPEKMAAFAAAVRKDERK